MTTLVLWVSSYNNGPSALHLGADSRFTILDVKGRSLATWDHGAKLYASRRYPDVFGYAGLSLFATSAVAQLCAASDAGALERASSPGQRAASFEKMLAAAFDRIPRSVNKQATTVLYCTRDGDDEASNFTAWSIEFVPGGASTLTEVPLKSEGFSGRFGTGSNLFKAKYDLVKSGPQGGTARSVYWALVDAIDSNEDSFTGGSPQLVVLNRSGCGQPVGVRHAGKHSLFGLEIPKKDRKEGEEWRDELFQMINPKTGAVRGQRYGRDTIPSKPKRNKPNLP